MENHADSFFSPGNSANTIMESECEIGDIAGIPFNIENGYLFRAKTTIDLKILNEDAPISSIKLAEQIIEEMEKI